MSEAGPDLIILTSTGKIGDKSIGWACVEGRSIMMTPETLTPREAMLLEQIALLREQVRLLTEKLDLLERHNAALEQHNAVLRLKVDAMARKLFGRSSEKLDPAQLQMVFDALREEEDGTAKKAPASDCAACGSEAEAEAAAAPGAKRRKRTLEEVIAGLPTSEMIIDPPEVTARPEAWQCIGAEETRLIDYTPGKFSCQKLVRRKYVSKEERHLPPVTAPLCTPCRTAASPRPGCWRTR